MKNPEEGDGASFVDRKRRKTPRVLRRNSVSNQQLRPQTGDSTYGLSFDGVSTVVLPVSRTTAPVRVSTTTSTGSPEALVAV